MEALIMTKAVADYVQSIIQNSMKTIHKIQTEDERKALSNASLPKITIELSEKEMTPLKSTINKEQNQSRKKRGSVFPMETKRPSFKGKQPREKSLLYLEEISQLVDTKNAAEFKDFIFCPGLQDVNGNDLIIVNTSKLPKKVDFTAKKVFKDAKDALCLYAKAFIAANVSSGKFVVIIHGSKESTLPCTRTAGNFYKMLKNSFSDRLQSCIIHKPELKLKMFICVCRPFLKKIIRSKIFTSKTDLSFLEEHGIAESVLDY